MNYWIANRWNADLLSGMFANQSRAAQHTNGIEPNCC